MNRFAHLLGAAMLFQASIAQVSPYTGIEVLPPDSAGNYRLLISGHFHGSSTNGSGYPAATLLANIDALNATKANILLSTGDLFLRPDRDSARYVEAFFSKLRLPLFNAPGNHDLEGKAYSAASTMPLVIDMGRDRIILLDTERDNSDISGDQLQLIDGAEQDASNGVLDHLFIVSHRPIWAEREPRYGDLFHGNTRSLTGGNFKAYVLPELQRIAKHAEVYWISGSMAGGAPASIFFQQHEANITFIQSAIRDELRDAALIADVSREGITWTGMSLTGGSLEPVKTYDAAWWKAHQGKVEPFHWRRIPYLIKKVLITANYWYGCGTVLLLLLLALFIRRKRF